MRLRLVLGMALVLLVAMALPASAAPNHTSATYTNNGCSWSGYHNYDEDGSDSFAFASTSKRGGNCVEVSVRMKYGSTTTGYNYGSSYASLYHTGWSLDFQWSDHNADPLGPPPYVGFRMN